MDINIFSIFSSLYQGFVASSFFGFIKILAGFILRPSSTNSPRAMNTAQARPRARND